MPFDSMPFTVFRFIIGACSSAVKAPLRRASGAGRRNREASMGLESLEQRMALTVAAPFIRLAAASDTGISKTDGYTRVANPVFTGVAPARSTVSIFVDGQPLPVTAKASARGAWSLQTTVQLPDGPHTITGTAVLGVQPPITLRPFSMVVDRTAPTATSLTWSSGYGSQLTFSEPVLGVRAANLRLTGRTEVGVLTNVPINDNRARGLVGPITVSQFDNNTKFIFKEQRALAFSGTYTLSFVNTGVVNTGVVDQAGNPLAANALFSFTID